MDNQKYIALSEMATLLSIDPKTAGRWVVQHNIRHISIANAKGTRHTIRVWRPDLDRFIEEHKVEPKVEEPRKPGRPIKIRRIHA